MSFYDDIQQLEDQYPYSDDRYEQQYSNSHSHSHRDLWWWGRSENDENDTDLFFFSDWFQNGTFNYEEYHADVSTFENNIHGYSDIAFNEFLASSVLNVAFFIFFMGMYELLRRKFPNVYASRKDKETRLLAAKKMAKESKTDDGIGRTDGSVKLDPQIRRLSVSKKDKLPAIHHVKMAEAPLNWVSKIFGVSWRQVRESVGLDAYFYLRYIRMCFKITFVSALWGIIILFPIYAAGDNGASGWYHVSMANVTQGSSIIWVSVMYLYFFTFFVLYVMKQEYKHFVELRLDFLGKGDGLTEPQHQYSVMVENIPKDLRSDKALYNYFDKLFPGKVFSANVILKVPGLEELSRKKVDVSSRLEKAIAYYHATGRRPTHITGRPRTVIDGLELTPVDTWYDPKKVVDLETHYRVHESVQLKSGMRVDSIEYCTRKLQHVNNKMFLIQKEKAQQAENGDKSLRGFDKWFTNLSQYVDRIFTELDHDSKDEDDDDSDILDNEISYDSWSSGDSSSSEDSNGLLSVYYSRKSSRWHHPATREKLIMTMRDNETNATVPKLHTASSVRFAEDINGTKNEEKDTVAKQEEEEDQYMRRSPSLRDRSRSPSLRDRIGMVLTSSFRKHSSGSLSTAVSGLSANTPLSKNRSLPNKTILQKPSYPSSRNKLTRNETDKSKELPLLDNDLSYETQPRQNFDREAYLKSMSYDTKISTGDVDLNVAASFEAQKQSNSCFSESMLSRCSTRSLGKVAGRMGFDFGAYLVKIITRRFNSYHDDEKKDVLSSTGFVTFLDLATVTCVASAPLTHKPKTLNVTVAPERRDILWDNCSRRADVNETRELNANISLVLGAILWSVPLAGVQIFATADTVSKMPGLAWILDDDQENIRTLINSYLPVVALLTIILILPYIFEAVAIYYEHRKTLSDVNRTTVSRYFYYQLANIYISVTAGSIWISAQQIISRPYAALEILGNSLPAVVGYFITLIVTKMLAGLPIIILRPYALSRYLLLRLLQARKYMTQRELDNVYCLEPVYYGWEYPSQMLVIVICFTYATISPIILIFGAMYFIAALMVYKKQVLYVYTPFYESGGDLFPMVCDRTLTGLICGQLTFMGYSIVRGGHFLQVSSAVPLITFTFFIMRYFRNHYVKPSKRLTLELAMQLDEKIMETAEGRSENSKYFYKKTTIPQDTFDPNYYRQPVMTEPSGEPLFYRMERQDDMTKQVRKKLKRSRLHVWEPRRNNVVDEDTIDELDYEGGTSC